MMFSLWVWLAPGIHSAHQSVQTHPVKLIPGELGSFLWPLPTPPVLPLAQALHHESVHLVERPIGIPRPEVVPLAAKHGRQFRDDLLHLFPALPVAESKGPRRNSVIA
jgi:hypothetical protein